MLDKEAAGVAHPPPEQRSNGYKTDMLDAAHSQSSSVVRLGVMKWEKIRVLAATTNNHQGNRMHDDDDETLYCWNESIAQGKLKQYEPVICESHHIGHEHVFSGKYFLPIKPSEEINMYRRTSYGLSAPYGSDTQSNTTFVIGRVHMISLRKLLIDEK